MDEERTYVNLRLMGELKKSQFITTTSKSNILGIVDDTLFNNFITGIRMDNFESTNICLRKLYAVDVKSLIKGLIEEKNIKGLSNILPLLNKANIGLKNLRDVYDYNSLYKAHFDSLIHDYSDIQISSVEDFLDKNRVKYDKLPV